MINRVFLGAVFLLWGCAETEPQIESSEFSARYMTVKGSNSYDSLQVIEITGHDHKCYVLRTMAYGSKTNLWCEASTEANEMTR